MLINKLNVLLTEHNLTITKMSKDTGLSRTTLTLLANNHTQGIQFDTLNKICLYLNINPSDFFEFIPLEIAANVVNFSEKQFDLQVSFLEQNKVSYFLLDGYYNLSETDIFIDLSFSKYISSDDKKSCVSMFKKVPVSIFKQIELDILNQFSSKLKNKDFKKKNVIFNWPNAIFKN